MIGWRDEAVILSYARHGESAALLEVFARNHGRHKGIVRGGGSRKQAPNLQPGHVVSVEYSARLEEHLGTFRMEPERSFVAQLMSDQTRLAGFQSIAALTRFSMEERDPHRGLYRAALRWLEAEDFARAYLEWELVLLEEAGFELDLKRCAVTGQSTELSYISPKSGRAVSREAAGEWANRLLPYSPAFSENDPSVEDIIIALEVTEYFLTHWLAKMIGKSALPDARTRFVDRLQSAKPHE